MRPSGRARFLAVLGLVFALGGFGYLFAADSEDGESRHRRGGDGLVRGEPRPPRLAGLGPERRCPLANALALPGVPAEAGLGPGRATRRGVVELRRGPVYVVFPGVPRVLDFQPGRSRWLRARVLFVSRSSYRGPVVVRGRRLDRRGVLRFGAGTRPRSTLRLPAGPWMEQRRSLRVWGRAARPRAGWRLQTSLVRTRASSGAGVGCFGYQVEGNGFSYPLVFGGNA
jgi:hypothetical protein